ncbi:undecaprenyl-diphosphatase UppP [Patescibacteria group bacterium]|nr:undecaprenyl-diphosphatase UppP [Patescibacteria group bacterium]MBU4512797.1 undecaprenyl-diphosphatase UppP [Patescibacteria group bacterium]
MSHPIILGIIQGLTEFLPISSSGHLILVPKILGIRDQGLDFDVIVHLGTLVAVLFAFRKKLRDIFKGVFGRGRGQEANARLGALIILSIIPAGLAGFLFKDLVENNFRSNIVVAANLIFWGLVLWLADSYSKRAHFKTKNVNSVGIFQTITVALSQALALIPGTSRSGVTMSFGMLTKMDRKTAVEFSFLISIPIIAAAAGYELFNLLREGIVIEEAKSLLVGFAAAAISGFIAIKLLLAFIKRFGFKLFAVYRILLGAAILILL